MLSICMPSNRSFAGSIASIEDLSSLSKVHDVESIVFDNSRDNVKSEHIERNSFISIYNKNAPLVGGENSRACISAATKEFVLMIGDDDRVCFLASPRTMLEKLSGSHIGIRPVFIPYSKDSGALSLESFSTEAETAKDRVAQYFLMNRGMNLSFYSIYNRRIFSNLMQDFYDYHPTKAGFTDWPLVLALVSMGKISVNKNFIFYYCIDNWNTKDLVESSNENIFKSAGLPLDAMCIQSALTALDSFALISRKNSPISGVEKCDASFFAMSTYYDGLIRALSSNNNPNITGNVKRALDLLEVDSQSDSQKLINLLTIVETWVPGLARKYQNYFSSTIDPFVLSAIS